VTQYPHRHHGAALVIGYAPSVHADVKEARRLRPEATLLGVKFACVLYAEIEHVWTQHVEEAHAIRKAAGRRIYIHARNLQRKFTRNITQNDVAEIDYLWPDLHWAAWSSGFAALLWARHGMGFDEVIGCGITLDPGGYCEEIAAFKPTLGDYGASYADRQSIDHWRQGIIHYRNRGKTAGVYAMSGWLGREMGAPC
jgi:hypothetical protein